MIHIHVITPSTTPDPGLPDALGALAGPELLISQSSLDIGPPSVESEIDEALSVPGILAQAIKAERNGADAIVIDCMGDPGVKPARELLRIPVLGPAETGMHVASMLGQRFSVVTILDSVRPMLENRARLYGAHGNLASVEVVDMPVLELEARWEEVRTALADKALHAVTRAGADVILLGCTGFLGCAAHIAAHLRAAGREIPVIDPLPLAVAAAQALVRVGLTHSKRTWPTPPAKPLTGFDLGR